MDERLLMRRLTWEMFQAHTEVDFPSQPPCDLIDPSPTAGAWPLESPLKRQAVHPSCWPAGSFSRVAT